MIIIFEDAHWPELLPLTWTRPPAALRCGPILRATHLAELAGSAAPPRVWCRSEVICGLPAELQVDVNQPCQEATLFISGAATLAAAQRAGTLDEGASLFSAGRLVACRVSGHFASELAPETFTQFGGRDDWIHSGERREMDGGFLRSPFDLLGEIDDAITRCLARFAPRDQGDTTNPHRVNPSQIRIAESAQVSPLAFLDASSGPILIDQGATIGAFSVIVGPAYIGPKSIVHPQSRLRGHVVLGPQCKVGGELEAAIMIGYSNKQHDGFLGHSVLGEWINLGAGTITSDLKNTYGPIRLDSPLRESRRVWSKADTPSVPSTLTAGPARDLGMFAGSVMGDHAKLGIGTLLTCGTLIGVASQVTCVKPPRWVPSFTWLSEAGSEAARPTKMHELMRRTMARRNVEYTPAYQALIEHVYEAAGRYERELPAEIPHLPDADTASS